MTTADHDNGRPQPAPRTRRAEADDLKLERVEQPVVLRRVWSPGGGVDDSCVLDPTPGDARVVGRHTPQLDAGEDEFLSGEHFRLHRRRASLSLENLAPTNGTRIDGHAVADTVSVDLEPGTVVRAGGQIFVAHRRSDGSVTQAGGLVGVGPAIQAIWESVVRFANAPQTASVLIRGETGTGKEVVARALYDLAPDKPRDAHRLAINIAEIDRSLIQSELFGHKRGAFTGANEDRDGCFVAAGRGLVLLDEIGDMPLAQQVVLLRVLQERRVRPIGGRREEEVGARICMATNKDLEQMVAAGLFRADLYFRLRGLCIELPPLRDRREDIPRLAAHFAERQGAPDIEFLPNDVEALLLRPWPGNVRELGHAVQEACLRGLHSGIADFGPTSLDLHGSRPQPRAGLVVSLVWSRSRPGHSNLLSAAHSLPSALDPQPNGPPVVVGRNEPATGIDRADRDLSRAHFKLIRDGRGLVLENGRPRNGTRLNGQSIRPDETIVLEAGDVIRAGRHLFVAHRAWRMADRREMLPLLAEALVGARPHRHFATTDMEALLIAPWSGGSEALDEVVQAAVERPAVDGRVGLDAALLERLDQDGTAPPTAAAAPATGQVLGVNRAGARRSASSMALLTKPTDQNGLAELYFECGFNVERIKKLPGCRNPTRLAEQCGFKAGESDGAKPREQARAYAVGRGRARLVDLFCQVHGDPLALQTRIRHYEDVLVACFGADEQGARVADPFAALRALAEARDRGVEEASVPP